MIEGEHGAPEMASGNRVRPLGTRPWRMLEAAQRTGTHPLADLSMALSDPMSIDAIERAVFSDPRAPLSGYGDARSMLRHGAPIEILRAMRTSAKSAIGPETIDEASRSRGLLAFGLVLSATLVHHRQLDTTAGREPVEELLLVIAGAQSEWMASIAASALGVMATLDD